MPVSGWAPRTRGSTRPRRCSPKPAPSRTRCASGEDGGRGAGGERGREGTVSDSPSLPTAFGIEAVEWSQRGEDSLTVQVTGRWRRRRPLSPGQPLLVLEAEGHRHRFPAMPEPPGLTGAAPGTWQMSFTIPVELA